MLGKRFVVISLLAGALALTAAMAPETLVRYIGGGLSPRAAISDSFMPVLRRMIAIAAGILSVLVMLLWYSRGVICHAIRMMVAEWRDLRIRIRQGGWGLSALECLGLGMVFAVALGIRLWYLRQPIAFDEATTVNLYASSPWYIAMANYSQPGNHILHTVLVRLAVVLGGYSEPIIRVPAFLAGLLCVPAAYLYARMVYSRGAGLMAAGWMASSLPFVYMSVNARGYTIVAFYGILAHVAILQLARKPLYWAAVVYSLSLALGLSAVPVALLYCIATAAWFLLYQTSHGGFTVTSKGVQLFFVAILVAGGVTFLLYMPALIRMGPHAILANEWVVPMARSDFIRAMPAQLTGFLRYNLHNYPAAMKLGVAVAFALYLVCFRRVERVSGIPFPVIATVTCLVVLSLNARYPLWGLAPMWMFLSVLLAAACAGGVDHVFQRWGGERAALRLATLFAIVWAIIPSIALVHDNPRQVISPRFSYLPEDIALLTEYLAELVDETDKIMLDDGAAMHHYYWKRLGQGYEAWDWDLVDADRVFVITTDRPHPNYAPRMWRVLSAYGVDATNDLVKLHEFSRSVVWRFDLGGQ